VRFLSTRRHVYFALFADASRLGIDYRKGQPGLMGTANGSWWPIGEAGHGAHRDIVVNNVDAAVVEGSQMPFALLGMSFLTHGNEAEARRCADPAVLERVLLVFGWEG